MKVETDFSPLKKDGAPIIIVGAVQESEAVANACRENGIKVSAVCDSEPRRSEETFPAIANKRSGSSFNTSASAITLPSEGGETISRSTLLKKAGSTPIAIAT